MQEPNAHGTFQASDDRISLEDYLLSLDKETHDMNPFEDDTFINIGTNLMRSIVATSY